MIVSIRLGKFYFFSNKFIGFKFSEFGSQISLLQKPPETIVDKVLFEQNVLDLKSDFNVLWQIALKKYFLIYGITFAIFINKG